jgi:hypothetical protein
MKSLEIAIPILNCKKGEFVNYLEFACGACEATCATCQVSAEKCTSCNRETTFRKLND